MQQKDQQQQQRQNTAAAASSSSPPSSAAASAKGVSFAQWILQDEHARTMRRADSSLTGLSDYGDRMTPMESVNGGSVAGSYKYTADYQWRWALIGMCTGTVFTAGVSVFILGYAGRRASFTNLLDVVLTAKQSRLLLVSNFLSICFAGGAASAIFSWFSTRRRMLSSPPSSSQDVSILSNSDEGRDVSPFRRTPISPKLSQKVGEEATTSTGTPTKNKTNDSGVDETTPEGARTIVDMTPISSVKTSTGNSTEQEDEKDKKEKEQQQQEEEEKKKKQVQEQEDETTTTSSTSSTKLKISSSELTSPLDLASTGGSTLPPSPNMTDHYQHLHPDSSSVTSSNKAAAPHHHYQLARPTPLQPIIEKCDASTETQMEYFDPSCAMLSGNANNIFIGQSVSQNEFQVTNTDSSVNAITAGVTGPVVSPLLRGQPLNPNIVPTSNTPSSVFSSPHSGTQPLGQPQHRTSRRGSSSSSNPNSKNNSFGHRNAQEIAAGLVGSSITPPPGTPSFDNDIAASFVPHALRTIDMGPRGPDFAPPSSSGAAGGAGTMQYNPASNNMMMPNKQDSESLSSPRGSIVSETSSSPLYSPHPLNRSSLLMMAAAKQQRNRGNSGASNRGGISPSVPASPSSPGSHSALGVGADGFKWWDNVSAATTAATGTILALHIGMRELEFHGPALAENMKADIDDVSRLVSIALELGDSFGAVIDHFDLQWIVMSFNVLRPCTDHERAAATCALAIRNRILQLSAVLSSSVSPSRPNSEYGVGGSTGNASSASPLTNPSLRPLVPFSIGIDRGLVLGGHVGYSSILRSFVLYGTPVERARDLAVLGSTVCNTMSPILVTETYNDVVAAHTCSLLVDFVEFCVSPANKMLYHVHTSPAQEESSQERIRKEKEEYLEHKKAENSPALTPRENNKMQFSPPPLLGRRPDVPSDDDDSEHNNKVQKHVHDDNNEDDDDFSPPPGYPSSGADGNNNAGGGGGDSTLAFDAHHPSNSPSSNQHSSARPPFAEHINKNQQNSSLDNNNNPDNLAQQHYYNRNFIPESQRVVLAVFDLYEEFVDNQSNYSTPVESPLGILGFEDLKPVAIAEYLQAISFMKCGRLDDCLDVCAKLEGRTMRSQHETARLLAKRAISLNNNNNDETPGKDDNNNDGNNNNNNNTPSMKTPISTTLSIPMWLFQVKRHLLRLRRNVQMMLSKGLEGHPYCRQTQSRWATWEGDMMSPLAGMSPLGIRHLDVSAFDAANNEFDDDSPNRALSPSQDGVLGGTHRRNNNNKRAGDEHSANSSREMSLDVTVRSIRLDGTSRSLGATLRSHKRVEDSPSRLIAALHQQASMQSELLSPNSQNMLSGRNSALSDHNNNENINKEGSVLSSAGPDSAEFPRGSSDISPGKVMIPGDTPNRGGEVPDHFQSVDGTWYRCSKKILGSGAFGAVTLGIRPTDGILVAMKVLSLEDPEEDPKSSRVRERRRRMQSPDQHSAEDKPKEKTESKLDRIVEEVRLLTTLRNNNVVSLLSCAVVGTNVLLLLEYVSGGALDSLLNNFGTFDIPAVQRYLKDVVRGLRYIHSNGYIHRDIKPANILMHIDGSCKLADLGSSIAFKESLPTAGVQGTPYYMAPEHARGAAVFASDIWSVGICTCQLLSGKVPLTIAQDKGAGMQGLHRLLYHLMNEEVLFTLPEVVLQHENILSFVMSCLKPNPEDRPTAEQLLMHPFLMQQFRNRDVAVSASPSASRARKHRAAAAAADGTTPAARSSKQSAHVALASPSTSTSHTNKEGSSSNNTASAAAATSSKEGGEHALHHHHLHSGSGHHHHHGGEHKQHHHEQHEQEQPRTASESTNNALLLPSEGESREGSNASGIKSPTPENPKNNNEN